MVHGKEKKLPKNYRIDNFLWNIWYFMENKGLYGVAGNLEKQGFLGKKLPRDISENWEQFFQ